MGHLAFDLRRQLKDGLNVSRITKRIQEAGRRQQSTDARQQSKVSAIVLRTEKKKNVRSAAAASERDPA